MTRYIPFTQLAQLNELNDLIESFRLPRLHIDGKDFIKDTYSFAILQLIHLIMAYPDIAKNDIESLIKKSVIRCFRIMSDTREPLYTSLIRKILSKSTELVLDLFSSDSHWKYDDFEKRIQDGYLAGYILSYIWKLSINGMEGSVNKSIHILSLFHKVSESKLRKSWSTYKNVSYYYAATLIGYELKIIPRLSTIENIENNNPVGTAMFYSYMFLNFSMYLCQWATSRIEKRTGLCTLDIDNVWCIPADFIALADSQRKKFGMNEVVDVAKLGWAMTQEEMEALESYKANLI